MLLSDGDAAVKRKHEQAPVDCFAGVIVHSLEGKEVVDRAVEDASHQVVQRRDEGEVGRQVCDGPRLEARIQAQIQVHLFTVHLE